MGGSREPSRGMLCPGRQQEGARRPPARVCCQVGDGEKGSTWGECNLNVLWVLLCW